MKFAGIILAAGSSERMGWPKALLEIGGVTFADRLIGTFATHLAPVVVVLGASAETIRAELRRAGEAEILVNPDFELGQITSLQCALRALPAGIDGFCFTTVDCPMVRGKTVELLVEAHIRDGGQHRFAVPRYQGRHGHPVCCDGRMREEFLALSPGQTAREVLHKYVEETLYLDVEDPAILDDVDTPEEYKRLLAASRTA